MDFWQQAQSLTKEMVERRRDLHRHPESGWTEFRTAAMIAQELTKLGYEVKTGSEVIVEEEMMGLPSPKTLEECAQRAILEGAEKQWVDKMAGGKTGVLGIMHFGRPGKVVGLRFDMDCNDVGESTAPEHFPRKEGFASLHDNLMHACGHDGHVTIGLAVAKLLAAHRETLSGTVKFFFQPGEEGVRGARAMVASGIVDDVDYFLSGHVGFGCRENNALVCMTTGFLATSKLDATFTGLSAHAGGEPEGGKNALLAAASASLALHGIPRHSGGASRINVGVLKAGTGRNVIADTAYMQIETRGATTAINDYVRGQASNILQGAANMYDVKVVVTEEGGASAALSSEAMGREVYELLAKENVYNKIYLETGLGGSEDCSYFMDRVQAHGGQAIYMMYGSEIAAGHHNRNFNFDESTMPKAAGTIAYLVQYYGQK